MGDHSGNSGDHQATQRAQLRGSQRAQFFGIGFDTNSESHHGYDRSPKHPQTVREDDCQLGLMLHVDLFFLPWFFFLEPSYK